MDIYLTNTLGRTKEKFVPINGKEIGIYSCGPTVYNYAHLGNLRAYVSADVLRRILELNGYKVNEVINITDVGHLTSDEDFGEDKLEKGAEREGKSVWEIAKYYTDEFIKDLKALNIEMPANMPKASEHIEDMIGIIKMLEEKGFTYISGGNVYFDTSKFPDYGKLVGGKASVDETKARVEEDPYKKHPFDFVLWFTRYKYKSHAMQWESPWGKGFPGWHIECSAMASKYLGDHFDIHTGGIDHIPVHHTNEIAQSEAAFGHKWVNYWLHNDWLVVGEEKMAKSAGEFLRLQTLIDKGYSPLDYRYYLLTGHYRSQLSFSWEGLNSARNSLNRLKTRINQFREETKEGIVDKELEGKYQKAFLESVNDDLNTAKALAIVWKTIDDTELSTISKLNLISYYDKVLALDLLKTEVEQIPPEVLDLALERQKLRENNRWENADKIRSEIAKMGYEVEDKKDGYEVHKIKEKDA